MRRALLDAAMALFSDRGVHATRLEDVTERADLGKGAFYNYFDSKDALVAALVGEGADLLEREHLSRIHAQTVGERVAAVVAAHFAFFGARREYVMLFHQARGLLKVRSDGAANLREVFRRYLESIERAVFAGEGASLSPAERQEVAALVVGSVSGYLSFRMATGHEPTPVTVERALAAGVPAVLAAARRDAAAREAIPAPDAGHGQRRHH